MDSGEIAEIYNRNAQMIYRICFTFMKSKADAEDCTQDTFFRMIRKNMQFKSAEHEKAWLIVTAQNVCRNSLALSRRKNLPLEDYDGIDTFEVDETISAVLELPQKYKTVIYLYFYEDYKTDEIAALLRKNPSTVRSLLRRGKALLKVKLKGDFDETV